MEDAISKCIKESLWMSGEHHEMGATQAEGLIILTVTSVLSVDFIPSQTPLLHLGHCLETDLLEGALQDFKSLNPTKMDQTLDLRLAGRQSICLPLSYGPIAKDVSLLPDWQMNQQEIKSRIFWAMTHRLPVSSNSHSPTFSSNSCPGSCKSQWAQQPPNP